MDHYACEGTCGGANKEQNTCNADGCTHKGNQMQQCSCDEEAHLKQVGEKE